MQHFKNTRCYDVTLLHTKHTIFRIYNTNGNAVLIALSASQTLLLVNGRLTSANPAFYFPLSGLGTYWVCLWAAKGSTCLCT